MSKTNKKQRQVAVLKEKRKRTSITAIKKKNVSTNDKRNNRRDNKVEKISDIESKNRKHVVHTNNTNNTSKISLQDINTNIATQSQVTNNNKSSKKKHKKGKVQLIQLNNKDDSSVTKIQKLEKIIEKKRKKGRKTNSVDQVGKPASKNIMKTKKKPKINIQRLKEMLATKEEDENKRLPAFVTKQSKKIKEILPLRERMIMKLKASRFRYLNETLYSNSSTQSKKYFKENPEAFTAYHEGYKQQVAQWPLNPLDVIIESIKNIPKDHIIADFGCGEARLAASVPQKIHSFDLVSVNERVQACDIAHTPLLTNGVHVVVFCLSLMGTNLGDYIREANRILKKDGILKIAEIESRFDQIEDFIKSLNDYGFVNTWKDLSHNLFYFLDFKKVKDIATNKNKLPEITLKSCVYKKR